MLVLQAVGSRCVSQLSIRFFLPSRHPLFSVRSAEKGTSTLRYPDSFSEFKHLNMINCSAPLVKVEIFQRLVNLLFPTFQKRSESEDYTTQAEGNAIKSQHWKQYHPYFKQLVPSRGSLTLWCQLLHFSGSFCGKQQQLRCICGVKSL